MSLFCKIKRETKVVPPLYGIGYSITKVFKVYFGLLKIEIFRYNMIDTHVYSLGCRWGLLAAHTGREDIYIGIKRLQKDYIKF